MANPNAVVRLNKNVDDANRLIALLSAKVSEYRDMHTDAVNYGHVGDLYRIRTLLSEALNVEVKELD